jgi:hypothetical protein
MELIQWSIMGVIATVSIFALAWLSVEVRLAWYTWVVLITGVVAILFGFAWAGASFLEGIAQSGAMALTLFSGGGVVLLLLTWRFLIAPELKKQ